MNSTTQVLSSVGAGQAVIMGRSLIQSYTPIPFQVVAILCKCSDPFNDQASPPTGLKYGFEVTGDDPKSLGPATSWITLPTGTKGAVTNDGYQVADLVYPLEIPVTAFRAKVVEFNSGTLTVSVIQ